TAQHEKGSVKRSAVEGHEAIEACDRLPELAEELGLRVSDELKKTVRRLLLASAVCFFVPDAASARLGIDHRQHHDPAGERPERKQLGKLRAFFVRSSVLLEVSALGIVERVPIDSHRFDIEDDARHGDIL